MNYLEMDNEKKNPIEKLKDILNTPNEKSAVKAACRRLLDSLNISDAPIPLKPLCQRFNLNVIYNNAIKKEDSLLRLAPNGFEIEISKQKNWRRNRFTIAHELTHLIIFKLIGTPINSADKKYHDQIELLCDIGAAELLMSEDELKRNLSLLGLSTKGLKGLYDKFMVSYDALFLKLADVLESNIIIWKNYARTDFEKKEYRVLRHFPRYRESYKPLWLPQGCTKKHVSPNPFKEDAITEEVMVYDDFKIIMNDKNTPCNALVFMFPHSRNNVGKLPIFDDLTVTDEVNYDDCCIMILFSNAKKFEFVKQNFIKV